MHTNDEMQALLVDTARRKVGYPLRKKVTLGILGGIAISLGFLAAIRAMAPLTALQSPVVSLLSGLGAILLAYIFGHYLGLTKVDVYGKQVATMAMSKVTPSVPMIFFSAIGANWLVAIGV